jgi:hypothetical protein
MMHASGEITRRKAKDLRRPHMKRTLFWLLLMGLTLTTSLAAQAPASAEPCADAGGAPLPQACLDAIAAYTPPDLQEIRADSYTLGSYSFWRVGPHAVNVHDGPGGAVIRQIPEGFNFVNVLDTSVEGWLAIQGGGWIQLADAKYVEPSQFRGVRLPEDWSEPFAWVLDLTGIYASTTPGGPSSPDTGLIPLRYQRLPIFAEAVDDEGWTWYLVGPDQWVKQIYLAVVKPLEELPAGVSGHWAAVDLFEQTLVAYEDDQPVFATLISSGLPKWETNEGLFEVWARLDRDSMSGATGAPDAYALQSVPWTMYFDDSISLHGTYWHDNFGYRRSRGCVNLSISDARYVYEWMASAPPAEDGEVINLVYVFHSDEYR